MIVVLINILIVVVIGAIAFWVIDKYAQVRTTFPCLGECKR